MKPIDFVIFDGNSSPNIPAHQVAEAMERDIRVVGPDGEYEILSYYLSDGRLILEVQPW